jgi:hypothetical protein
MTTTRISTKWTVLYLVTFVLMNIISVNARYCTNGQICNGVEVCGANDYCECPINGLTKDGKFAATVRYHARASPSVTSNSFQFPPAASTHLPHII